MKALQFRETAKKDDVRIDMEMNNLTSEQEEKMKELFIAFADEVKKNWENKSPSRQITCCNL